MPVAVILAGGLGTRLRPLTLRVPKPLLKVNGKPFLHYILSKVRSMGMTRCMLLTGYKGSMVEKYCGSGKRWGLNISYSCEDEPLGTGGALLNARGKLSGAGTLLVMNGDSFVDLDVGNFLAFHRKRKAEASIFSLRGDLTARGAIELGDHGRVAKFLEKQKGGRGVFNTGAYLIEEKTLDFFAGLIKNGRLPAAFSMEKDGFPLLAARKALFAYVGEGHFLDMGTFESLSQAGGFLKLALGSHCGVPAVFVDRDGVVNRHSHGYVKHPDEFEFEPGALGGMKALCRLGLPLFIVTNQSMVGRGIASRASLLRIHAKMLSGFRKEGIRIKDIFICPHPPEKGCNCRKPKIGMLLAAQDRHGVDLSRSFVIGDATGDILMGNSAGCTSILVKTGHGGKDGMYSALPHFTCRNLKEAARAIRKELGGRAKK